jgi:hypothetical protein
LFLRDHLIGCRCTPDRRRELGWHPIQIPPLFLQSTTNLRRRTHFFAFPREHPERFSPIRGSRLHTKQRNEEKEEKEEGREREQQTENNDMHHQ